MKDKDILKLAKENGCDLYEFQFEDYHVMTIAVPELLKEVEETKKSLLDTFKDSEYIEDDELDEWLQELDSCNCYNLINSNYLKDLLKEFDDAIKWLKKYWNADDILVRIDEDGREESFYDWTYLTDFDGMRSVAFNCQRLENEIRTMERLIEED